MSDHAMRADTWGQRFIQVWDLIENVEGFAPFSAGDPTSAHANLLHNAQQAFGMSIPEAVHRYNDGELLELTLAYWTWHARYARLNHAHKNMKEFPAYERPF